MSINVLSDLKSPAAKVYQFNLKNRAVINWEFNKFYEQKKLKWMSKIIKYSFSVFII